MGAYANNETFVKWQSPGGKKVYTLDDCKAPKRPRSHDYGGRGYGGRAMVVVAMVAMAMVAMVVVPMVVVAIVVMAIVMIMVGISY